MNYLRKLKRLCPANWSRLMLCGLALSWSTALADPSAEYYRACQHASTDYAISSPHLITRIEFNERAAEGSRRAKVSCAAFVEKLAQLPAPTAQQRFALFQGIIWIGEHQDEDYCTLVMPFVNALPDNDPDALMARSTCAEDGEASLALLLRSLEGDIHHPRHGQGLAYLYSMVWRGGAQVDTETLLRHWNTRYETARFPGDKIIDAALIYTTAVEAEDWEAAEDIRERVRSDMGLDSLDFERREATLELLCDQAIFDLDFESLCTGAMERLAAEAASLGTPLPPDILRPLESAIHLISDARLHIGGGGGAEEHEALTRLRGVLERYPDHLKSSEHFRVYAEGFLKGSERVDSLRRASHLDPRNLAARCGLANSLRQTSPDEAWSLYADLAAQTADLPTRCDPQASLRLLEERAHARATGGLVPQSEIKEVILR